MFFNTIILNVIGASLMYQEKTVYMLPKISYATDRQKLKVRSHFFNESIIRQAAFVVTHEPKQLVLFIFIFFHMKEIENRQKYFYN